MKWFEENKIPTPDWPANSPHLNPLTNIWGILVRNIYRKNDRMIQYNSKAQLKTAINVAWRDMSPRQIQTLAQWSNGETLVSLSL